MTYLVYNSSNSVVVKTIQNYLLYSFYYYIHSYSYANDIITFNLYSIVNVKSPVYSENSFNEWLAGIIDGDGHFDVKENTLTIMMESRNYPLLSLIHNRVGGYIRPTSNRDPNVARIRIKKKSVMIDLIHRVNGNIRNSVRVTQFIKICEKYNITYIPAIPLVSHSAWLTGFFDSDGGIHARFTYDPMITIYITNKYIENLNEIKVIFGGAIRNNTANSYKWSVSSKIDVLSIVSYFKNYPPMSHKMYRVQLVEDFYRLRQLKAYKSDSSYYSEWLSLANKWKNYGN